LKDPRPSPRVRDPDALRTFRLRNYGEPCELCELRAGTHAHHKIFRSQGGDDVEENLMWLCLSCHDDIHSGRVSRYDL
jgi:5-methylcytosine-specific restriction endonuclease McrA